MIKTQRQDDLIDFQMALWKLIETTLNSYLPTPSNRKKFKALQNKCIEIIEKQTGDHCSYHKERCTAISYLYKKYLKFLDGIMAEKGKTTVVRFLDRINFEEYDLITADFLKKFEDYIRKYISPFVIGSFLHGSLATVDYTGFSDVDAGIFVKNEVMFDPRLLKKLQNAIKGALRLILKYDNLQHHGLFIIPEGFLTNYPKEYLPVDVFKYAKTIGNSFRLSVKPLRNLEAARVRLLNVCNLSEDIYWQIKNLYDLKHKLSIFMLLPSLYLQTKNIFVYKKLSFDIAKKELPKEWWVMDKVSRIRREWMRPCSYIVTFLLEKTSNPWIVAALMRKVDWKVPARLSIDFANGIAEGMALFTKSMIEKIA